jgi:hypothetical protein
LLEVARHQLPQDLVPAAVVFLLSPAAQDMHIVERRRFHPHAGFMNTFMSYFLGLIHQCVTTAYHITPAANLIGGAKEVCCSQSMGFWILHHPSEAR